MDRTRPRPTRRVAEADANLKRVWDALQRPPLAGKSTLFITSDHGFAPVEKLIRPNVVLKELGLVQTDDQNKPVKRQAWCVAQGGSAFVYLLDDGARAEALPRVKGALAKVDGIEKIIEPAGFAALGLPTPDKNPEAPDLVLTTGPGYSFNNDVVGEAVGPGSAALKGTHGHLPGPDYMHATFVAVGTGIKPGVVLETVQNTDVAPTIAELLKVKLPTAEGRVLREVLAP